VAWANLFARGFSENSTGKLLLAHATRKYKCDTALEQALFKGGVRHSFVADGSERLFATGDLWAT